MTKPIARASATRPLGDSEPVSAFVRACRRMTTDRTPVWLMRQAGRYMTEYRNLRAKHSMLDLVRTAELAAEITLQPVAAFDVDAAIIFSDLLPPLVGMGLKLEYVSGDGPVIHNPIERPEDVARLTVTSPHETMGGTLRAIELVAAELQSKKVPVIGFAGAPFTLASYAIEGRGSRNYAKVKSFMRCEPGAWSGLMNRLVDMLVDYLRAQAESGASALQVFDSWAGQALGAQDYERFVAPYNQRLFSALGTIDVPVINFSTGTAAYIDRVAECGGDVVGVDWRMPIDTLWERIGHARAIQGNLDPVALLASWPVLAREIDDVLARCAGRPGHIFNVGHGVLPGTPVGNVRRLVDYVHERTSEITKDQKKDDRCA